MAGYDGYSKSNNAVAAEEEGLLPLSRINGAPRWAIRMAGKLIGSEEWHHTSKSYNRTEFYNADRALRCATSLKAQYKTKAAAEIVVDEKHAERRTCRSRHFQPASKIHLNCLAWTNEATQRTTGVSMRELLHLLRQRGSISVAARNRLATELADSADAQAILRA